MKFIAESTIDKVVDLMEQQSDASEDLLRQFGEQQAPLLAYLCSESFDLLTDEERNYLTYLSLVAWGATQMDNEVLAEVPLAQISEKEEANWDRLKGSSAKKFRDRITPFFEDYPQEDLLAFVEDALVFDQEDNEITNEGREYLFIALKTVIDSLCEV